METAKKGAMRTRRYCGVLGIIAAIVLGISAATVDRSALPAATASEKLGPIQDKVSIYVTSWCPYCGRLERFLRENDVAYTRYDIERNAKGSMLYRQLGGGGVPVIQIGSSVFRGFDEGELAGFLMERRKK